MHHIQTFSTSRLHYLRCGRDLVRNDSTLTLTHIVSHLCLNARLAFLLFQIRSAHSLHPTPSHPPLCPRFHGFMVFLVLIASEGIVILLCPITPCYLIIFGCSTTLISTHALSFFVFCRRRWIYLALCILHHLPTLIFITLIYSFRPSPLF